MRRSAGKNRPRSRLATVARRVAARLSPKCEAVVARERFQAAAAPVSAMVATGPRPPVWIGQPARGPAPGLSRSATRWRPPPVRALTRDPRTPPPREHASPEWAPVRRPDWRRSGQKSARWSPGSRTPRQPPGVYQARFSDLGMRPDPPEGQAAAPRSCRRSNHATRSQPFPWGETRIPSAAPGRSGGGLEGTPARP